VWQNADGSLGVAEETGPTFAIRWTTGTNSGFDPEASELLIVTDLDGDGRDDLLFRDFDDRLVAATSASTDTQNAGPIFSLILWTERSAEGLELIASLDLDRDGRAELAWYDGIDVVLWSASDTF
jgi:hypothetical protein